MAPLSTNAISHFMHPAHALNQLTTNTSYLCDGCKLPGTGTRFTCTVCTFDLHDYCANCPTRLTSTTNHQHPMSLVVYKLIPNQTQPCQVCHSHVKGLAYHCKDCNFWVHPLCVSTNSGNTQDRGLPSGLASVAQSMGQQVAVGLASRWAIDKITGKKNEDPSVGLDPSSSFEVPLGSVEADGGGFFDPSSSFEVPPAGVEVDDGGFFDTLMSGFMSFFESSSSS